jgi:hypothetical protein
MRRFCCILAFLLVAAPAAADAALKISYVAASPRNYAHAYRPAAAIRLVVIHVTEATYAGTISWFRNPSARVSAHYVVSRSGAITQMVPTSRAAWHSGNPWVNAHSIGIEHEGITGVDTTFTDAEYRASAELAASVLRRDVLPIDRRHVIGHNEVPDPFHPPLFGGASHHTDPGTFWDWRRYMAYIRSYARGVTPPPLPFDVSVGGIAFEQTLAGTVPWTATTTGATADHVEFLVDGKLRDSEHAAPYAFAGGWDTTRETNGRHVLGVQAVEPDGTAATTSIVVNVKNPPIKILRVSLADGQTVSGSVRVEAAISRTPLRVEFLVDDAIVDTETALPYAIGGAAGMWDTTRLTNGPHTLTIRAIGPRGGTAAKRTIHVDVENP